VEYDHVRPPVIDLYGWAAYIVSCTYISASE